MEVTFDDFCNRVKEDTEKTTTKVEQYRAAVKYFNEIHESGSTVSFNETFTPFQNGVLNFLNEKFEKQVEKKALYTVKDLKLLFISKDSDFRYGYNYARKVSQAH